MSKLTHLSLFSGIGGLDLAAEMAGIETVGQCEWADFPTNVLEKHWPNVPRWRDIRDLTGESFYERTGLRTVDIVSGGFPCQPFSLAGKRNGEDDDRYLWPEMLRVIKDLRPSWVIGENVPGIINLALDQVLSDLEDEGYSTQAFVIPACGVDAPHRRDRVAILAYSSSKRMGSNWSQTTSSENGQQRDDDRRGIPEIDIRKLRSHQSRTVGMVNGIQESVHTVAANSCIEPLQGCDDGKICGGGYYRNNLHELLECNPLGRIGWTNPEWIEWLMGFPIGWTELKH